MPQQLRSQCFVIKYCDLDTDEDKILFSKVKLIGTLNGIPFIDFCLQLYISNLFFVIHTYLIKHFERDAKIEVDLENCLVFVLTGDPLLYHSYFIVVCVPHRKQLSPLELISHGRLGTFVKKTVVLCSLSRTGEVVCTSLQWAGIG